MALTRRSPARCALLMPLIFAPGCSTEHVDPIILEHATEAGDPCRVWTDVDACGADTVRGCSFQPNPSGCLTADPTCGAGICSSGDPFVRRTGESLSLRGAPYRFVGAVSFGVAWAEGACTLSSMENQAAALERTFDDLVPMRVNALKIGAFQSFAGASGKDYSSIDRVVAGARRAGVRLVLVLENHYPPCTRGGPRTDDWYDRGYTLPYDGYALSYTEYVRGITDHFRDEPTILAWELMHEARAEDFGVLDRFAQATSALVRATDPNHLIALGLDNGSSPGTTSTGNPSNYQRLHDHAALDLLDAHDFTLDGFSADPSPLPRDLLAIAEVARTLRKPVFAGMTGVWIFDVSPAGFEGRASTIEAKIAAALGGGFAGFLLMEYVPDWQQLPAWQFDARSEDPLGGPSGVIARHAPRNQ